MIQSYRRFVFCSTQYTQRWRCKTERPKAAKAGKVQKNSPRRREPRAWQYSLDWYSEGKTKIRYTHPIMQIVIPVKKHVHAFLTSYSVYGSDSPKPIEVRKDSYLGHLLSGFLATYPVEFCGLDAWSSKGYAGLHIDCTFPINPAFLTDENLLHIGEMLEYHFKWSLIMFTQGAMSVYPSEQGGVKRFYQRFSLSEEAYDYEAAFKIVQRFRNRGERPELRVKKSRPVLVK